MLQLTGGRFKGRKLVLPSGSQTRPTQSKIRQALFNIFQGNIQDAHVLDLFAGSGSFGFEALSRGARSAVFVDEAPGAWRSIEKNIETLDLGESATLLKASVHRAASKVEALGPYDLIFLDPPYGDKWNEAWGRQLDWAKCGFVDSICKA